MENASKALIIAGAILLSILIISLGLIAFNNAKNTAGSSNLNKQEIEAFNSEWQAYEGTKKTASEVKTMAQAIIASNAAETKAGTNRWITVSGSDTATCATPGTTASTTQPTITTPTPSNATTYTIKLGYSTDGLVVAITWGK